MGILPHSLPYEAFRNSKYYVLWNCNGKIRSSQFVWAWTSSNIFFIIFLVNAFILPCSRLYFWKSYLYIYGNSIRYLWHCMGVYNSIISIRMINVKFFLVITFILIFARFCNMAVICTLVNVNRTKNRLTFKHLYNNLER